MTLMESLDALVELKIAPPLSKNAKTHLSLIFEGIPSEHLEKAAVKLVREYWHPSEIEGPLSSDVTFPYWLLYQYSIALCNENQ